MNKINSRFIIIGISILIILLIGVSGTFAWFTWSSKSSPPLTMTIGELVDITFDNGPNLTTDLAPVFNYTDGEKMSISIKHKGLSKEIIGYSIKLNIINIAEELKDRTFKYKLVDSSGYEIEGELSNVYNNSSIDLIDRMAITSEYTNYTFYLYIDGNMENNPNMAEKKFTGNIEINAYELETTPLSDFIYVLGSDKTIIDKLNYYNIDKEGYESILINPITISPNDVLLIKYNGTSEELNIPNEYKYNENTYNTILLSELILNKEETNKLGIFKDNNYIKKVNFGDKVNFISYDEKGVLGSSKGLFEGCTLLETVSLLPETIIDINNIFNGCISLTGKVRIGASEVNNINNNPFHNTEKNIIVEVPNNSNTFNNLNKIIPNNVTIVTY